MATSLAAQLSEIAAKSTNQLDLKAQKAAHSQSLIFEKKVAGSQDFNTVYQISLEGFQELCLLDSRFVQFGRSIFSEQSKSEDRTEMTAAQNEELNVVLEAFLGLAGSKLLLKPAVKAVDWLVRRFRVHEYNTSFLLLTFLPYHTTPLFLNLLSILPSNIPSTFKFLHPYIRSLVQPPRHPIVHSASTNVPFFTELNSYVLRICKSNLQYHGLLSFWAGITTEAVAAMLESARSGRQEVERQRQEDVLLRILPVLNQGLSIRGVPELATGCYMISVVVASKAATGDKVLDALMEAVVGAWSSETQTDALVCLAVLAERRSEVGLPKKVVARLQKLEELAPTFSGLRQRYQVGPLVLGLLSETLTQLGNNQSLERLEFISEVFRLEILNEEQNYHALGLLITAATEIESPEAQSQVADLFESLNASKLKPVLHRAIEDSSVNIQRLESALQSVISDQQLLSGEDVEMEEAPVVGNDELFQKAIATLPERTVDEKSFLSDSKSRIFEVLAQTFLIASKSSSSLETFCNLPILRKDMSSSDPLYLSFFVRVACGPFTLHQRTAALKVITSFLEGTSASNKFQVLLPYLVFALADDSGKIRREASNLLIALSKAIPTTEIGSGDANWDSDGFYGVNDSSKELAVLSSQDVTSIIDRVFLSNVENFILDASQVGEVITTALQAPTSSPNAKKDSSSELKKSIRLNFFAFLSKHAITTPLLRVKLGLVKTINRIDKVGTTTRTMELLPIIRQWTSVPAVDAVNACKEHSVDIQEFENQVLAVVSPASKEAVDILLSLVQDKSVGASASIKRAALARMQTIWPSIKPDSQLVAADNLLALSLGFGTDDRELAGECRELLRSITLSETILLTYLAKIEASLTDIKDQGPAPKRRRTSQNEMVAMSMRDSKEVSAVIQKMTFILELVDSSKPENHPNLTEGLFHVLASLHHFKSYMQSELGYLLSLLLGSLLAIVNKIKETPSGKLPAVNMRADLVVDCVRTTESPQVQNTALLLIAGLAQVAPEVVLHSVMPIFTFMGSNVLRKDDEYSAHVIDQTIDQVIPPLILSLRTQKRDIVSGTSELLLSFTTAFEHIPSHRRLRLFEALIVKLGSQDFFFAVLAMLAKQYPGDAAVRSFMTSLAGRFSPDMLFTTYKNYLNLVADSLESKPKQAQILLGVGTEEGRDARKVALELLHALSHLLKTSSMGPQMSKILKKEDTEASKLRQQFSGLLEQVLAFVESVHDNKSLHQACSDVLGALLGTLSLPEFIETIRELLERPNDDLRRKVLRLLDVRLQATPERNPVAQNAILDFLPVLMRIIEESPDTLLKHAAVACIDRISDKYGKKDVSKVAAAAKIIAGQQCIGQADDRIRIMGVLCLSSMVEVLGQAIIPILPEALSRASNLLQISLEEGQENQRLHDAVFSLFSALFSHVPFMIADNHLDSILKLSFESANSDMGDESDENRREALQLLAKQVDVAETFAALERNWSIAITEGPEAAKEALDVLRIAIEKHPKSSIVKNVESLAKFFFKAFDLRRIQFTPRTDDSYEPDEVEEVENAVNEVAIKMIYKMNDTTFRPLFVRLTEWATSGLPRKDVSGRNLRLTSFYSFLEAFFDNLKSIVTSYAGYITESAIEVLNRPPPQEQDSTNLWTVTMKMLRNAFEHDQDEYWQTPTHFSAILSPLLSQLSHAASLTADSTASITIPTIVSLASASADSPDNTKELNTALIRLFRDDGAAVRLAAVQTQRALTARLGEEWLVSLPEMLPGISEALEDEDEEVEREVRSWVSEIEGILGESLEGMLG